jgi:hypothetical protein
VTKRGTGVGNTDEMVDDAEVEGGVDDRMEVDAIDSVPEG